MADVEAMKRRAAAWAVEQVDDGMVVGLGTGSTAAYAIEALGDADLAIRGIPTSIAAADRARAAGIALTSVAAVGRIDVAIDGADQIADRTLLKGGGGAHTTERIVDAAAERFIVVADERKEVDLLDRPVPLEVLSSARRTVIAEISALGGDTDVRSASALDGPAYTERGNLLVDANFGSIEDPDGLAATLWAIPGVVDHGLFLGEADSIAIGTPDGVRTRSF